MSRDSGGAVEKGTYHISTPLNAVTATTTSNAIQIAGAKRITLALTRANHGSGSSAFKVTVSVDGVTFVDFNKLIENINSDAGAGTAGEDIGKTRITTKTLSGNGTSVVSMELEDDVYFEMKVVVTETTDGTHTAKVIVEY